MGGVGTLCVYAHYRASLFQYMLSIILKAFSEGILRLAKRNAEFL